jgi:predicted transposase YdaD
MSQDHDSSYKFLFSNPELVRDLIIGFIPDDWLHSLDYSTLEKVPGHYVTEDFQQRADDIVWRVKVGGEWLYLYLLIEFQSSVDKYMALRMMVYTGLLYQDLIKRGDVLADGRLPPILPIVLYNGSQRWTAATEVADLIPAVPGLVEQFKPKLRYLLIDENAYSDSQLVSVNNLVAAVFRLEHPADPQTISDLLTSLNDWLSDRPDLRRMFALWIRATLMRKPEYGIVLPQVDDLQEINIMLSQRLEEWAHRYRAEGVLQGIEKGIEQGVKQGIEQGIEQGLVKGESKLLRKLLERKFGPLPVNVADRLNNATEVELERWGDAVLTENTLDAIFGVKNKH